LLKLLALQQQETLHHRALNQASDAQLAAYILLLEQQWQQLKQQTKEIEDNYKQMLGMHRGHTLTPKKLAMLLKEDARRLEAQLKQTQSDRRAFEQDIEYLKVWLKYYDITADDDGY